MRVNKQGFISRLVIYFLFSGTYSFAQKTTVHSNQQWVHSNQQYQVSDKAFLLFDAGYRMKENFTEPRQLIVRGGIAYSILPNVRIAVGVAYADYFQSSRLIEVEYRTFQDIQIMQYLVDKLKTEHRLRIEERFVYQANSEHARKFSWRFRYKLGCDLKLFRFYAHQLSFYIGDEVFINAGEHIVYNVFDQNRFMAGISFQWSKNLGGSLLYNYQFSAENKPDSYKATDIVWLSLNSKLNLKSKRRS